MAKRSSSDAQILVQVAEARRRAQRRLRTEPHAKRARFVKGQRMLHVVLTNGAAFGATVLLRAAGSVGGAARTRAKKRAARLNGMKGGRPRKTAA
jgi:hypothetical protein